MLVQLFLATAMVTAICLVHLVGLAMLTRALRSHSRAFQKLRIMPLTILLAATVGLIGIHTLEIWLYAGTYLEFGAFRTFEEALYFSTVTYSTLGYGDMVLSKEWRVFGAIEAPVGIMMLGWSTAYLVSVLSRLKLFSHDWLTGVSERDGD